MFNELFDTETKYLVWESIKQVYIELYNQSPMFQRKLNIYLDLLAHGKKFKAIIFRSKNLLLGVNSKGVGENMIGKVLAWEIKKTPLKSDKLLKEEKTFHQEWENKIFLPWEKLLELYFSGMVENHLINVEITWESYLKYQIDRLYDDPDAVPNGLEHGISTQELLKMKSLLYKKFRNGDLPEILTRNINPKIIPEENKEKLVFHPNKEFFSGEYMSPTFNYFGGIKVDNLVFQTPMEYVNSRLLERVSGLDLATSLERVRNSLDFDVIYRKYLVNHRQVRMKQLLSLGTKAKFNTSPKELNQLLKDTLGYQIQFNDGRDLFLGMKAGCGENVTGKYLEYLRAKIQPSNGLKNQIKNSPWVKNWMNVKVNDMKNLVSEISKLSGVPKDSAKLIHNVVVDVYLPHKCSLNKKQTAYTTYADYIQFLLDNVWEGKDGKDGKDGVDQGDLETLIKQSQQDIISKYDSIDDLIKPFCGEIRKHIGISVLLNLYKRMRQVFYKLSGKYHPTNQNIIILCGRFILEGDYSKKFKSPQDKLAPIDLDGIEVGPKYISSIWGIPPNKMNIWKELVEQLGEIDPSGDNELEAGLILNIDFPKNPSADMKRRLLLLLL